MIQRVLSEKAWMGRMTAEDFRALMPLIYGHISPYDTFVLDMASRLDIEPLVFILPTGDGSDSRASHRYIPATAGGATLPLVTRMLV
jgi:hypothetical protein